MAAVDRKKLYEQVWTIPGTRLATLYGISDVGLAKVCLRYKIPRPPPGYWAKLAAGKSVPRTKLPQIHDEQYRTVLMQGWDLPEAILETKAKELIAPMLDDVDSRAEPHVLAANAREQLSKSKLDQNGLVHTDLSSAFDVRVSPPSVDRATRVLDSLIRKWEARGGTVEIAAGGGTRTALAIGPDQLSVQLYEEVDERKTLSDPARLTGRLAVTIDGDGTDRTWGDRKTQRLEKVLGTVVATAVNALEFQKKKRLDAECIQRQKERSQQLRAAARAKKNLDFRRRQCLTEQVKRWTESERIRGYLAVVKEAIDVGKIQPVNDGEFWEWFEWAKSYAEAIDPIGPKQPKDAEPTGPSNTPIAQLDLTAGSRSFLTNLGIKDSDELYEQFDRQVKEACGYMYREYCDEYVRVLECLGYAFRYG